MTVSAVFGAEYSYLDFEQISDPESGLGIISGGSGGGVSTTGGSTSGGFSSP